MRVKATGRTGRGDDCERCVRASLGRDGNIMSSSQSTEMYFASPPETGFYRQEADIIANQRFDTHELQTYPDLSTLRPWDGEDIMIRRIEVERSELWAACLFGFSRLHLAILSILLRGSHGANGTVRYAAWDGRDYDTSPRLVDDNGQPRRRIDPGASSYRELEARYGVARCTLERAYERFVETVIVHAGNGTYEKIQHVLSWHMERDLGNGTDLPSECDWLERLSWDFGDVSVAVLHRCPKRQVGRDPVRALAYRLVHEYRIQTELVKAFRMPSYQSAETLAREYADVQTVVGQEPLARIMGMLADSLS